MKHDDWEFSRYCAKIVGLDEFWDVVPEYVDTIYQHSVSLDNLRMVCTSGGYDPIHPGHISNIFASADLGDLMVVIVNGDSFLEKKKGKPFQDLKTRCQILSSLIAVDIIVPFEIDDDPTVIEALKVIKPTIFTKGGDRADLKTIPEWDICAELNIQIVTGVGIDKAWSSSDFLKDWEKFRLSNPSIAIKELD